MLLFQLGLLLVLLPVCCFTPGFVIIRKLRWNPLEKLCGSVGLSLILLYLVCWGIYCVGTRGPLMPLHAEPFAALSVVCALLVAVCAKDIGRLFRAPTVRRAVAGYGFLLLWTAVLMAIIRNYSGALWFGDWLEHFQRTLFFLHHFPAETQIMPFYTLPARPPMLNVIAAFFLGQTADRFELFQAVFVFVNLLLFLPCYLMMPALGHRAKRRTWLLVLLFASSPLLMQNVTYTWTKAAAAFYVVLALWFYLSGWRKRDSVRIIAAFVALAAGLLVHYSAGPYVAIVTLHYLIKVLPARPQKWRELAGIIAICGLLVGTWLLWSMAVYGVHGTLASNTTVTSSQQYRGSNLKKMGANMIDSLVPVAVRAPERLRIFDDQRREAAIRDWFFLFYQVNAIFGMGVVGGLLALWLALRQLRWRPRPKTVATAGRGKRSGKAVATVLQTRSGVNREQQFWAILIVAGFVLGIAVVGERDPFGVAHLTLLALQMLGVTLIAAVVPWRRQTLAILVLAGCAVDFSMGVLLQAHVESLDNTAEAIVFPGMEFSQGAIRRSDFGPEALSPSAWSNWFVKHQVAAYYWWNRALETEYGKDPAFQAIQPQLENGVKKARQDDINLWQGWFDRHDGEAEFLGDHVAGAGNDVALALLVVLFLGLAAHVYRQEKPVTDGTFPGFQKNR